jgi:hypothetical protein
MYVKIYKQTTLKLLYNFGNTIYGWSDEIMSIVAGVLVCAFVYVIRASLVHPGEEDWSSY